MASARCECVGAAKCVVTWLTAGYRPLPAWSSSS
eukprot:CAMPEP_0181380870 /NCGR_PEP_ID=MMETSP1106-20121128/19794_1 /TAXON_ID=81844 /ORGANISM="Mantoniella antarctica, Strain SL-175" /LENGTH=33 /DNA_ID= /DNA_START= /DNA_END= /DNA_ORIENTATION=